MIRKTATAVVLAGALALGTASATSLGSFGSPLFAASDVDLLDCAVPSLTDLVDLVPDIGTTGSALDASGATFDLATLDVTAATAALAALDTVTDTCVLDTQLQLVLLDGSGNVLDIIDVDPDAASGNDAIVPNVLTLDVASIAEIRAVLTSV